MEPNEATKETTTETVTPPIKKNFVKSKWFKITAISLLIIMVALGAVLATLLLTKKDESKVASLTPSSSPTPTLTPTVTPTLIPTSVPTATPVPDPYAGWKTYYSNAFDLTFRYPSEYTVTTAKDAIFDCSYVKPYLKDPSTCTSSTKVDSVVAKKDADNTLNLYVPAGPRGFICDPDFCTVEKRTIMIKGKTVILDVYKDNATGAVYQTNFTLTPGAKSVYSNSYISINTAVSKTNTSFDTFIKVLESIY